MTREVREQAVALGLARGITAVQVARCYRMSISTVRNDVKRIRERQTATGKARKLDRWERDPYADETPREARRRVDRELAEGKRCRHPMFGGPCSLLLPCWDHRNG